MSIILRRLRGAEVLGHKVHLRDLEGPPVQVGEEAGVGGEGEAELIGVQGLPAAAVAPVVPLPAVLAVPQKGTARVGELGPDLVGPAGAQLALHQGQPAPVLKGLI